MAKTKAKSSSKAKNINFKKLAEEFAENEDIIAINPTTLTVALRDYDTGERLLDANGKLKTVEIDKNLLLSSDVKLSLNTRHHGLNLNILVVGGSGSGKTRFFAKPNIMQLNTSYVITDPKGEILYSTGKMLSDAGYDIRMFNLWDTTNSFNYNPFAYVYNIKGELVESYVMKMVTALMKNTKEAGGSGGDKFWEDSTTVLIQALSFYMLETDPKNACFPELMKLLKLAKVDENDSNAESELDQLFLALETEKIYERKSSMAVKYYKDFKQAAGETAKSILISVAVRLQTFNLPQIMDLTHTDNLSLDTIGDKKSALFVILPVGDTSLNFLAAMMYTQLFDNLFDVAENRYGGRLPIHVRCILDEFANVGIA